MRWTSVLACVLSGAWLSGCGSSSGQDMSLLRVPVGNSPQRGPSDAWVTLVEFADFECSYCRAEEPVITDLEAAYGADLRLIFKYFPLTDIHPHAEAAAVAAECAGEQGKFWEMHDLLLTTPLDSGTLLADAQAVLGLDIEKWQAYLQTSEAASVVDADVALGLSLGVDGTPTFVINGVPVLGAVPEGQLRGAVEQARATAIASGVPRADYYDKVILGL